MKKLYLECNAGISGDMLVAALLDVGADQNVLKAALESIPASGFKYAISRVKKAGVDCCDFDVILDAEHENHDHDMEYLHGDAHHHDHEHTHEHEHHHHHEHTHEVHMHGEHHEHHHHHEHRGLNDVLAVIDKAKITDNAKKLAAKIFDIVAEAESKAHATCKEQVHFHEVGAIDSIVDVIAIAVCFDNLGVDEVIIPKLCEGVGTIRCQHGVLPVPVPATANIVSSHNLNLEIMNIKGEFVTPTGAAAAAALKTSDKLPKNYRISKIGLGAGKRNYEIPSILRAMLLDTEETPEKDIVVKLESDIDDCSGETLGYVMEKLLTKGARDVHYFPVFMKKNRPAYELVVICQEDQVDEMINIIFQETTTIGVRQILCERTILTRSMSSIETPYGEVKVKNVAIGEKIRSYPEYDSVCEVANSAGVAFQTVYNAAYRES